jgi:hypothetical protein
MELEAAWLMGSQPGWQPDRAALQFGRQRHRKEMPRQASFHYLRTGHH